MRRLLLALLFTGIAIPAFEKNQYNILYIMTDDHRASPHSSTTGGGSIISFLALGFG